MKQQIENIIKENLPEKKETCTCEEDIGYHTKECNFLPFGFNDCLSQINTSLIADEVLKVVKSGIEKIDRYELGGYPEEGFYMETSQDGEYIKLKDLLSTLSPNKENK